MVSVLLAVVLVVDWWDVLFSCVVIGLFGIVGCCGIIGCCIYVGCCVVVCWLIVVSLDVVIYDVVNVWVAKRGVVGGVFGWVVRLCVVSECVIN